MSTVKHNRVIVTGATGFLGYRAVKILHEKGFSVIATGRNPRKAREIKKLGVPFVSMDLATEKQRLMGTVKEKDIVIHCAALSSPWGKPEVFQSANVVATENVIKVCETQKVARLIHISTPSIYAAFSDQDFISEAEPPCNPLLNDYAKTKWEAEKRVLDAFQRGLSTVTLRPQGIFGEGDTAVFPRFIKANRSSGVPLVGKNGALLDSTYVDNVVQSILLSLRDNPKIEGKVYHITNGEPVHLKELLENFFPLIGEKPRFKSLNKTTLRVVSAAMEWAYTKLPLRGEPLLTQYKAAILSTNRTLDITAARQELGYQPEIRLQEGLERFARYWNALSEGERNQLVS